MNAVTTSPAKTDATNAIGRPGLLAMAIAGGIAVANIYYNQPMLGLIEAEFHNDPAAGLIPTVTQLGYALGLFLLLPLGDIVDRRRLIIGQFMMLSAALVVAAVAPSAIALVGASFVVGAASTVAQQIVPFAASLVTADKRGSTIGFVMAGVLSGILLSRTLSGFVGAHQGWREMFWIGVPLALIASGLMYRVLPHHRPASAMSYAAALRSLGHLWKREPALRVAAVVQAALFASFTGFWTILALYLETPAFELGADIAGLFGIVGAVGIFAAPLAGRLADRHGPTVVVWLGAALTLVAWVIFGLWSSLLGLVIGVIILDFGVQSALVSNQHTVYALDHAARSRLNTLFMTAMFLGGAAGSALASLGWSHGGWSSVSVIGAILPLAALVIAVLGRRSQARQSADH